MNRAQRHESACPLGGVLLSQSVYDRVHALVEVEEIGGIKLKGLTEPVSAYALKGFKAG